MSSENANANLNVQVKVKMEEISAGDNSRMDRKEAVEESVREINHAGNLGDGDGQGEGELVIKTEDLSGSPSNVKVEMSPTNPESDDTKCDTCSTVDVENITNTLAEKVTIKNTEPSNSSKVEECDMKDIETNQGNGAAEAARSPEKSVNKANKMNISGEEHHTSSTVILKQATDSLKNLLAYDSSSDDEAEIEENWQFRTINKSDTDSDDSVSSSDDDDDDEEDDEEDDDDNAGSEPKKAFEKGQTSKEIPITEELTLKIYSENNLTDLPPIRDVSNLDINVEKEEFLHMGHIEAVIDTLVTVEAIPGTPAYDLDTCLFVEDKTLKRPLGAVYDVIGPVASPLYCIRFKFSTEITELNLKTGMKVFSAPKSKYTRYVFVKELMKNKGTDASWVGDIELPPEIAAELSDEECQAELQEHRKPQKRKHGSQERHKQFEEDMNRCNTLNNHAVRLVEAQRHVPRMSRYNDHVQRVLFNDVIAQGNRLPPSFDPTVPPPGFHAFPRYQTPMTLWSRHVPVTPSRPPRCHLFRQNQTYYSNTYTNNDTSHGPGTSSHPY